MENTEKETEMTVYECGYLLVPTITVEGLPEEVAKLKAPVEQAEGVIFDGAEPTLIDLAYPIAKGEAGKRNRYNRAYFGWFKFELAPGQMASIKKAADQNLHVLRYLLIKTVRDSAMAPRRALLEKPGEPIPQPKAQETIKPLVHHEEQVAISEEELNKSIEKIVSE
jgi:ribosomal protein S6